MTLVAVSILNHIGSDSTIACVQSLLALEPVEGNSFQLEIFVGDNASASEAQVRLQQFFDDYSNVHFRLNHKNLGFSAGHNRNLQRIFEQSEPDYIWLLNNDCLVEVGALSNLIECSQSDTKVAIWGGTLLDPDGKTVQCAGGCFYNSWLSSYRQYGRGKTLATIESLATKDFDYIAGASLFFPEATLRNGLFSVGQTPGEGIEKNRQWLNERFFLYFEELDLARRLKPGLRMAWCKGALIRHRGGESAGTAENQRSELAEFHSSLSALRFTRLYYPSRLWFVALARYFSKFVLLVVRGDFSLVGTMTRAYRDFWKNPDAKA